MEVSPEQTVVPVEQHQPILVEGHNTTEIMQIQGDVNMRAVIVRCSITNCLFLKHLTCSLCRRVYI